MLPDAVHLYTLYPPATVIVGEPVVVLMRCIPATVVTGTPVSPEIIMLILPPWDI